MTTRGIVPSGSYCGSCQTAIGTPFCPRCGSAATAPPTANIPTADPPAPDLDLPAVAAQFRAARVRAAWALLGGAVLAGIGVGTFAYSLEAGGLVWGGAAVAGAVLMLRATGRLRRLGARWAVPAVLVIAAGLVGVAFAANSAGTQHADHAVNDVTARFIDRGTGRVYSETDLAQDLKAVCNTGTRVLLQNTKGDFGVSDASGLLHEPTDTPACSDLALPQDALAAFSLLATSGN